MLTGEQYEITRYCDTNFFLNCECCQRRSLKLPAIDPHSYLEDPFVQDALSSLPIDSRLG